ncbi:MAG: DNA replication and repair protein RecF [Armatimonadota bacterium]|nr:DNA replication and repair protein RecF [Armatimonadota bacterium]MDR7587093.1 DNA replication and repair protein RecF [Armatimonadota bacterium]MDR7612831.1 DNA replication and repair protein RecF [Armatimonadota bacterium]
MRLARLRAVNFRNHRRTDVALSFGANVFVGRSAQGKTSLLEAVGMAATGRSHRARQDAEVIAAGESWARVQVSGVQGGRPVEVDVLLRRDAASPAAGRLWKEIRVNGVPGRRSDLLGRMPCVLVSPDDIQVVIGPPVLRRRLIDRVLVQVSPAYFDLSQRYVRAVVQRNRLLRTGAAPVALEPWDEQVATLGAAVTSRRRELASRLARAAARAYGDLTGEQAALQVSYRPDLAGSGEAEMVAAARRAMAARRAAERARGQTLVGPHRDEVSLEVGGRPLGSFGSRGQQWAAVVALRLAEHRILREETGEDPVLLLDDVLQVLDEPRRERLLAAVEGAQVLLTATTPQAAGGIGGAAVYVVEGGTVEAQPAHLP